MQLVVKSLRRGCMVKKDKRLAIYHIYYLNKVYAKQILFEVYMANNITNSAVFDILSLFGIPTTTIQNLWQQHCEQKISESRDILFSEIEQGSLDNIGNDYKVSIMHRYMQAAMNGSARINLRLLAKAINSLSKGEKQSKPIYANEFNRYAQALETLSEDEINLLASMYEYRKNARPPHTRITARGIECENDFLQNFSKHYRYENKISEEQYIFMCSALLRTGLIYPRTYIRETTYDLSPFFNEIVALVDFQDALKKEKK